MPAAISRYDLASRQTVEGTQENLLTPGVFTDVFERFLTGLQKQDASGETGVGMGSAAYMLYSDYSAGYGREQSVLAVQAALDKAKASGRGLTGYAGQRLCMGLCGLPASAAAGLQPL